MPSLRRRAAAALFVAAAVLLGGGIQVAAPAAYAASSYGYNQVTGIATAVSTDVAIGEYTTLSATGTKIYINGKPGCTVFGHGVVTWCGVVPGSNGTAKLDTGLNYQAYGNDGVLHKYYLRFELYAAGECVVGSGDFNGYYGLICRS